MPGVPELGPSPWGAGGLDRGRFSYFPVVPGKLEFAVGIRQRILKEKPEVVAVELPVSLEEAYLQAVDRLPAMSVLLYPDPVDEDHAIYVPIEPADPFTEAIRTAQEIGARVLFLEPDDNERPHLPDNYPDTYAIRRIGVEAYIEAYRVYPQARNEDVAAHAAGMAWKLQGADPLARVLVAVSLNLLDPLLDAMEKPQDPPTSKDK
ncbi:MAG: hypothetical protein ABI823_17025, partial [Bryobacteraceae bacterium]